MKKVVRLFATTLLATGSVIMSATAVNADGVVRVSDKAPQKATSATGGTFEADFWEESDFDNFKIFDVNDDGVTWKYYEDEACARVIKNRSDDTIGKDDWMISRAMYLTVNKQYTITVGVRAKSDVYPETFEVKMGTARTVEGMTMSVVPLTTFTHEYTNYYSADVKITKSGYYYLGVHAASAADMSTIYCDYVGVSTAVDVRAPGGVTDLKVVPDRNGDKFAVVSFNAPTVNMAGDELTSITGVSIYRDDTLLTTVGSLDPGEDYEYEDDFSDMDEDDSAKGTHTWKVICKNSYGNGKAVTKDAYIGINKPGAPLNVTARETSTQGQVTITWDAPVIDIDGNPFNPANCTYTIYEVANGTVGVVREIEDTSYTYQAVADGDDQAFKTYAVVPSSERGDGYVGYSNCIPVGPGFSMPYKESFTGKAVNNILAIVNNENEGEWYLIPDSYLTGINSVDGDNGFFGMTIPSGTAVGTAMFGKFACSAEESPVATFSVYSYGPGDTNVIDVQVVSDGETETVASFELGSLSTKAGWVEVVADLAAYSGRTFAFNLVFHNNNNNYLLVDDIEVKEGRAKDLSIDGFDVPETVDSNSTYCIMITVKNSSVAVAETYTVKLYKDGELFASMPGITLKSGETNGYSFNDCVNVTQGDSHVYKAEIFFDGDLEPDDNTSVEMTAKIRGIDLPTVENLEVSWSGRYAKFTWEAPQNAANLTGYNIYKDGSLLATVDASKLSYEDRSTAGSGHKYQVSALYEGGESRAVMADLSGIDSAAADGVSVAVEGREIVVNGDYRGYVGVFDMSGKVYYSGEAVLPLRVSVDGGVYAVKYDGSLVKVIVK